MLHCSSSSHRRKSILGDAEADREGFVVVGEEWDPLGRGQRWGLGPTRKMKKMNFSCEMACFVEFLVVYSENLRRQFALASPALNCGGLVSPVAPHFMSIAVVAECGDRVVIGCRGVCVFLLSCDWLLLWLCVITELWLVAVISVCFYCTVIGCCGSCVQPICHQFIPSVMKSSTSLFMKMINTLQHSGTAFSVVTATLTSFGLDIST